MVTISTCEDFVCSLCLKPSLLLSLSVKFLVQNVSEILCLMKRNNSSCLLGCCSLRPSSLKSLKILSFKLMQKHQTAVQFLLHPIHPTLTIYIRKAMSKSGPISIIFGIVNSISGFCWRYIQKSLIDI